MSKISMLDFPNKLLKDIWNGIKLTREKGRKNICTLSGIVCLV